jgi:hypothetical protein
MKNPWKWILAIGAILSAIVLVGLLIFSRFWIGPSMTVFRHGMAFSRHASPAFAAWSPFGWLIFGSFLLMVVFGILFLAVRLKAQPATASGEPPQPLENCPSCGADLQKDWKYCPFCDFELP